MNGLQPMRGLWPLRGLWSSKKYVALIRLVRLRLGLSGSQSSSVSKESLYFNEFEIIDMTRPSANDTMSISIYRRLIIPSSMLFACSALLHSHMERTCAPYPKILLHIHILQIWEIKPRDLGTLTMYLPYKGRSYVNRISISLTLLYKNQASSSSRYVQFPNSHTFKVIGDFSITYLTFGGSLIDTLPVLSVGSSHFILQIAPIATCVMINSLIILCIIT